LNTKKRLQKSVDTHLYPYTKPLKPKDLYLSKYILIITEQELQNKPRIK